MGKPSEKNIFEPSRKAIRKAIRKELRKAIRKAIREEIFKLIDIEIRRNYRRLERNSTPEKHEDHMKFMENYYREVNASTSINKLIKKYKNLKNRNDNRDIYDENHKFSVFLDNLLHSIFQSYIVHLIYFLITGDSTGRYAEYFNSKPKTEMSVNDKEDIDEKREEKLDESINPITNVVNNSITNTVCFFSSSNEPEKNEVLISDLSSKKLIK